MNRSGPLRAVRVADQSTGIAGGYCTKLLADCGAEVVRIPAPELTPSSGSVPPTLGAWLHHGKVAGTPDRAQEFTVVVRDQPARGAAPDVTPGAPVDVVITPFGLTGPWRDRPWSEFTLQAAIGVVSPRGRTDRPPVMAGGRLGEWAAGSFAAAAAAAAVLWWRRDGRRRTVDVSMLECMALSLAVYPSLLRFGHPDPTFGIELPSVERTRDGWVGFCTMTPAQFSSFARMIGSDDWATDGSLAGVFDRLVRKDELQPVITGWTSTRTTDEIVRIAGEYRVPVTPIGNGATLPTQEPFASRRVFTEHGPHLAPRPPVRFALRDDAVARPARLTEGSGCDRPLDGVRVVDFTAFWAGPFATQYLATMGADVVKIESTRRPDFFRFVGTGPGSHQWYERGPLFHANNTGKRSVTLELDTDAGVELARRLIAGADVVVENFTPRVLDGFGLGHDAIAALNPDVAVVRMPAFGIDGPWRDRPGFAQTVEQASGMAWVTGYADDPPRIPRGPGDPLAGIHAAFAAVCATLHRLDGGGGGLVEVPLSDVAVNITVEQVLEYHAHGRLLTRNANASPDGHLQDIFACAGAGEWLAVTAASAEHMAAVKEITGDGNLAVWCRDRSGSECERALLAAGVPAAVVVDDSRIGANEQLRARGFFELVHHAVSGDIELPGWPFRFDGAPDCWYRAAAPLLGEHNDDVLGGELGLDAGALNQLRADGVIGEAFAPSTP